MDSYRHVTVMAPTFKEGDWYNQHPDRFALNPRAFDLATEQAGDPVDGLAPLRFTGAAHDLAERIDALVELFATAGKFPLRRQIVTRKNVIAQLLALREEGSALWPMTLLCDMSTLGKVSKTMFRRAILSARPGLAAFTESFENGGRSGTSPSARRSRHLMWSCVVGLRFASTATIEAPSDFKGRHLQIFDAMLRPCGVRHARVPRDLLAAIGGLAEHYRHHPETFGHAEIRWRVERVRGSHEQGLPHAPWLAPAWRDWMAGKDLIDCRHHARALGLLTDFFATLPSASCATPGGAFARANMKSLLAHAAGWSSPDQRRHALSKIRDFAEWLSIESSDDPALRFRPELFEQDIVRARAKWGPRYSGPQRKMTRPMPLALHAMCKEIITADDFAWPKSLSGAQSQWFTWHCPQGELTREFSPVMSRLLLLLLDLPIRGIQARRLDSGEGDDRRWDPETEAWIPNAGRHAGR